MNFKVAILLLSTAFFKPYNPKNIVNIIGPVSFLIQQTTLYKYAQRRGVTIERVEV